jgi:hypothetical protein
LLHASRYCARKGAVRSTHSMGGAVPEHIPCFRYMDQFR